MSDIIQYIEIYQRLLNEADLKAEKVAEVETEARHAIEIITRYPRLDVEDVVNEIHTIEREWKEKYSENEEEIEALRNELLPTLIRLAEIINEGAENLVGSV